MQDATSLIVVVVALILCILTFTQKKQLIEHFTKNWIGPLRWVFGNKPWISREEERAEKFNEGFFIPILRGFSILILVIAILGFFFGHP